MAFAAKAFCLDSCVTSHDNKEGQAEFDQNMLFNATRWITLDLYFRQWRKSSKIAEEEKRSPTGDAVWIQDNVKI